MKIVIVGLGKVGATIVENFSRENHELVVIDSNEPCVESIVNVYDVKGVVGSASDREVLLSANVDTADFFISCTSKDELNIISCILAKKLGAKSTIARVRDPEYFSEIENIKGDLGLDLAFNPEYQTAKEINQILRFPSAKSVEEFTNTNVRMVEFDVADNNPIIGMSVMNIIKEYQCKVLFAVVKREEKAFIPRGNFVIEKGDVIHIFATENAIAQFTKKLNIFKPKAKSVFIIGGGKIAYYLAKQLEAEKSSVKILEHDANRCKELSANLKSATILNGDGADKTILTEEDFDKADACVSLTGIDEENVIISLYAKQQNLSKVITSVDRHSMLDMANKLGLDTVLCPRDVIANTIIKFVRSHKRGVGAGINSFYKIHNEVEVLEFNVDESFPYLNACLKDLPLKRNVLIGGIIRDGEFILPSGDSSVKEGDKVLVVTSMQLLTQLNETLN